MLLKVPLDIVPPEELPDIINSLLPSMDKTGTVMRNKGRNIVLLSLWDLLRARRRGAYRNYVLGAALVLPISKSIVSGARFMTGRKLARYMPFNFVISLLTILERREDTVYLLGGKSSVLRKTEKNINSTFPRLRIVGRFAGAIHKQEEPAIVEAIRKVSPSLLLAGKGIRGDELWIARNENSLNSGFRLWCSDLFDVFAEKKRRPSETIFVNGLESIGYCFRNPLLLFRIFPYIQYKLLLFFHKVFSW